MSLNLDRALVAKLTNPEHIRLCWDMGVRPDIFEDPQCRMVSEFAFGYWLDNGMNIAPTAEIIHYEFASQDLTESEESTRWLVEAMKRRHSTNHAQEIMRNAALIANSDPGMALTLLHSQAQSALSAVTPRNNRVDMAANVADRRMRYRARQERGALGMTIGLPEVDEVTNGLMDGELAGVAGYAKTGKSFFLANAAIRALAAGKKPLIVTLEQSVPEFEGRLDALWSGVSYSRLQNATLTDDELARLEAAQDNMHSFGSLHVERPEQGERSPQYLVNRARQLECNFLIIDQLSFMEPNADARIKFEKVGDVHSSIMFDLKNEISRDDAGQIPCMLAVQFNRQSVSTKGESGKLHQMANTSDIERTVDIAYGLSRTDEMRANNSMKLEILGNRRGDIGTWLLGWQLSARSEIFVRERLSDVDDAA